VCWCAAPLSEPQLLQLVTNALSCYVCCVADVCAVLVLLCHAVSFSACRLRRSCSNFSSQSPLTGSMFKFTPLLPLCCSVAVSCGLVLLSLAAQLLQVLLPAAAADRLSPRLSFCCVLFLPCCVTLFRSLPVACGAAVLLPVATHEIEVLIVSFAVFVLLCCCVMQFHSLPVACGAAVPTSPPSCR
jgi:hypothetical protein